MRRFALLLMCAVTLVTASECRGQLIFHKKKVNKSTDQSNTAEPDKQLYDKAMNDIKHGRHETGRLGLQTLINTYPDSEYLAKAKLAIADSYFKEGGTSNITQAINGYKDFIVFFPFLPEAAYAQMQVAMANYNEMPKADRDATHTKAAEEEFQTFLLKYPKDPLAPQAEQRLREVQEVLAEGQFKVAYYYYVKGDRRAAAGRLIPLVHRYPLYSKSDTALWMLGDIFEKSERKDLAGNYYAEIVKNYPLSSHAGPAKDKLKQFAMPVPQPDPKAVEWMTAEQNTPRPKETVFHRSKDIFHNAPDVHTAAAHGLPNLEPDTDQGNGDILAGGNRSNIGTGNSTQAVVEVVKPGEAPPAGSANASGSAEDTNTGSAPTEGAAPGTAGATSGDANAAPASTGTPPATGTNDGAAQDSSATDNNKSDNTQPTSSDSAQKDNQKESSSKKKGLRKILPW
ncbi:MAG TPA: outer membrane protein assembly factor BamD [Candidatus Eremiobacteraceae bacterium]|nr:outer membrane protein assembly factor BamD [Candidatus Eremiobacteraceae bacterium]